MVDNVYNLSVAKKYGQFDLVLFFGVLYHLRHPLLVLDRIWDVCNESALLYVESHMIDEGLVDDQGALHRMDALNPHLLGFPTGRIPARCDPGGRLHQQVGAEPGRIAGHA